MNALTPIYPIETVDNTLLSFTYWATQNHSIPMVLYTKTNGLKRENGKSCWYSTQLDFIKIICLINVLCAERNGTKGRCSFSNMWIAWWTTYGFCVCLQQHQHQPVRWVHVWKCLLQWICIVRVGNICQR